MKLPAPLAPWARYLDLFEVDAALDLGRIVRRLDLAVGRRGLVERGPTGEPDGYHGLTRRGPYERLLVSEWALAEELPDEFARRAASAEHAFLDLGRRVPAGDRVSTVLFDSGPGQLGSPRLVHLAALIVLARRANDENGRLMWGVLQTPRVVHEDVTPESLMGLLESRSIDEPTDAGIEAWLQDLEERFGVDSERWLVCSPRTGRMPAARGQRRIVTTDLPEPRERRLGVEVRAGASRSAALRLDLPGDAACTRLLRDPLRRSPAVVIRPSETVEAPRSNLIFCGTKLYARGSGNRILEYLGERGYTGSSRVFTSEADGTVVAVGWRAHHLILVSVERDAFVVERISKVRQRRNAWRYEIPACLDAPVVADPAVGLGAVAWPDERSATAFYFLDGRGNLLFVKGPHPRDLELERKEVAAVAGRSGIPVCCAGIESGGQMWVLDTCPIRKPQQFVPRTDWTAPSFTRGGERAFFGFRRGGGLAAAMEGDNGSWHLLDFTAPHSGEYILDRATSFDVGAESRVVGVIRALRSRLMLVTIHPDRRHISLVGPGGSLLAPPAEDEIVDAVVSSDSPRIAATTRDGKLIVWDASRGTIVSMFQSAEES